MRRLVPASQNCPLLLEKARACRSNATVMWQIRFIVGRKNSFADVINPQFECAESANVSHRPLKSIPFVWQGGQRMKFDAFVMQILGFLRRGFAVDRAMRGLAVMHLAGFFRK